ncbi:unnamed protein product, partial [Rotaria sordida]
IIYDELCTVFGGEAPPFRTVATWSKWFRKGREEIEDKGRLGRSISETTSENIEQVYNIINDDPYITVEEVQAQIGLGHGTIQ